VPPQDVWYFEPPAGYVGDVTYIQMPSLCSEYTCPDVYLAAPANYSCPSETWPILDASGPVCVPNGTQVDITPGSNGCAGGCVILPTSDVLCLPQPAECDGDCPGQQ
jgi:hypothetical protein